MINTTTHEHHLMHSQVMLFFIVILNILVSVKAQTCQGLPQYSHCSSNPGCRCLKLAADNSSGICSFLYITCSELASCFGKNQMCLQPDHVCVQHPQCQALPLCYPMRMAINSMCPSIPETSTATTTTAAPPLPDGICVQAVWSRAGVTVAGGNGVGDRLNQLNFATGLFIDEDDGSVYVADQSNHRVIKWNSSDISPSTNGVVVADEKGINDGVLSPVDLVIDNNGTMYICDYGDHRVIRWYRGASNGETFIPNIFCAGLFIYRDQFLYVTNYNEHRVTRWDIRKNGSGEIVAGGHGQGSDLNQLRIPYYSFIDKDRSVYVADHLNHRIMKWVESAQEGILIAGVNESGSEKDQLSIPTSVVVDQMGSLYVTDTGHNRVIRYLKGSQDGMVIVGGGESDNGPDQLNEPFDISFDRNGNLYVADVMNYRIQMFKIDKSACAKFHS